MIPHVWSFSRLIPLAGITLNRDLAETLTWLPARRERRVHIVFRCVGESLWLVMRGRAASVERTVCLSLITEIYWIEGFLSSLTVFCIDVQHRGKQYNTVIDVHDYWIWIRLTLMQVPLSCLWPFSKQQTASGVYLSTRQSHLLLIKRQLLKWRH